MQEGEAIFFLFDLFFFFLGSPSTPSSPQPLGHNTIVRVVAGPDAQRPPRLRIDIIIIPIPTGFVKDIQALVGQGAGLCLGLLSNASARPKQPKLAPGHLTRGEVVS